MTKSSKQTLVSGWGGYPTRKTNMVYPRNIEQIQNAIKKSDLIARGNGRAYGDSSINEKNTINMRNFNRMISFDDTSGAMQLVEFY